LEFYKGPIEKLLELIEEQKLEVTRVSLVQVTGDFLKYIESLKVGKEGSIEPQILADFLVVASKLLLLKSKALIPALELNEEEEEEIRDLETRLKIYAELKATQSLIKERWHDLPQMFSREFLMLREPVFYPPPALRAADLEQAMRKLLNELERIMKPVKAVKVEIINLKKKIEEVIVRISEAPIEFNKLYSGKGRDELVALFLAILHLIKERLIKVEQKGQFGEIRIAKETKVG